MVKHALAGPPATADAWAFTLCGLTGDHQGEDVFRAPAGNAWRGLTAGARLNDIECPECRKIAWRAWVEKNDQRFTEKVDQAKSAKRPRRRRSDLADVVREGG